MQGKAQNHIGIKAHERCKGLAQCQFEHGPIMIKLVAYGSTKHKSLHQILFIYSLVHMIFCLQKNKTIALTNITFFNMLAFHRGLKKIVTITKLSSNNLIMEIV
jgi:hypothetical protein